MASSKVNDKDLAEIHALAKQWGKIVVRRAFGDQGPGLDVDLDAMEQVAAAAAAGLTAGALEEATHKQSLSLPAEQPCPTCGRLCPTQPQPRPVVVKGGQFLHQEPVGYCPACRRDFFPQRPLLRLDTHAYSPAILLKVVEAGGQLKSYALAARLLERLAEVVISPRHVAALTEELGEELRQARDQRTEDWLHHRRPKPAGPIPAAVAVAVDGGCLQTRAPGQGPGVHEQGWKEDKVACLHTLAGPTFADDPQPNPPACFLDPQYVDELVQELKSHKRLGTEDEQATGPTALGESTAESVPSSEGIVIAGLMLEEMTPPVPQEAEPVYPGTAAEPSVPSPEAIVIAELILEEMTPPLAQEAEPVYPGTAAEPSVRSSEGIVIAGLMLEEMTPPVPQEAEPVYPGTAAEPSVPSPEAIVIAELILEEMTPPLAQEAESVYPGAAAEPSVPSPEAIVIAGLMPEEMTLPLAQEAEPVHPGTAVAPAAVGSPAPGRQKVDWPPKRLVRTCVATQQNSDAFGPLVAQEAYARGFFSAPRRAFLGDGLKYNWTIQRKWFKDFEPIADFIHPLSYLYVAATAVSKNQEERWQLYLGWMTACWQGRVGKVLQELVQWQERLGPILPEEKPPGSDARVVVGKAVTYLENNQARMDYPRYRRLGLPVTSSAVESLIKEFNYRVKGTEKFWNRPEGTERILQVRAAVLSDDDRLSKHLKNRPGSPHRRYRAKDQRQ